MSFFHLRKITHFQVHPILLCLSSHANDVTSSDSALMLVEIKTDSPHEFQMHGEVVHFLVVLVNRQAYTKR